MNEGSTLILDQGIRRCAEPFLYTQSSAAYSPLLAIPQMQNLLLGVCFVKLLATNATTSWSRGPTSSGIKASHQKPSAET